MENKTYNQIYYEKNKERERQRARDYRAANLELARAKHREWHKLHGAEWREKNIDKVRASSLKWAKKDLADNPEKYHKIRISDKNKSYQKKYRDKNREKNSKHQVQYFKDRIKTDLNYRLRWLLRGRISAAFRCNVKSKAYKTIELLGCSVQEAKEHIEKQFAGNMSWDNHATLWEIDHILPVSSFDLTIPEEQKKAFNYKNLQPLIKQLNRAKGSKIIQDNDIV